MSDFQSRLCDKLRDQIQADLRNRSAARREVESRVRRRLAKSGRLLRKTRPGSTWDRVNFGDYYVVDVHSNFPIATHCVLDVLACDVGVLANGVEIRD